MSHEVLPKYPQPHVTYAPSANFEVATSISLRGGAFTRHKTSTSTLYMM